MKAFLILLALLTCTKLYAFLDYRDSVNLIEQQCPTNLTPDNESIFLGRSYPPQQYAAIIRYHTGITLREIIDETPFKGTAVMVLVLRTNIDSGASPMLVPPSANPKFKIKALDMIWIDALPFGNSTPLNSPEPTADSIASREIQSAAKNGDLERVRVLLKNNPDLVFSNDINGMTPLNTAARYGHKEVAELLLVSKADVNTRDKSGKTPLEWASTEDHLDVVKLLLANNAKVNATEPSGMTALFYTARNGHKEVAELLLANKADVNATNIIGGTPLHWAASFGDIAVVELLLKNNAAVNAKDRDGYTPLRLAVENGHLDVIELLLANKADVDSRDKFGQTPLAAAYNADVAKLLLANKADINAKSDIDGWTPLHCAAYRGSEDVAELLLASNAEVNAVSTDGYKTTPLELAVQYNHTNVAELIRQHSGHRQENTTEPLVGWYIDGDTGFQMGYQACIEKIPYDKAISDDVRNFVEKLPIVKDPFGFADRSENYWITHISFFMDGTGQHAVKIDDIPIKGTYQNYVLIYNKSDVRIKVIKFSNGHYQS